MTAWIFSIIGIIFLGVMLEIVIPDGKTNSFIKSIYSIILMFVIVNPIIKIFNKDTLDLSSINIVENNQDIITEQKLTEIKFLIERHLLDNGIMGVDVEVKGYSTNKDIIISEINVDISNIGILEKDEHINKYKLITMLIKEKVEVDEKNIIYG